VFSRAYVVPQHTQRKAVPKRARKSVFKPAKRRKTSASQPAEVDEPLLDSFESQLRESQPEDVIEAPTDGGSEAAVATTIDNGDTSDAGGFDSDLEDTFEDIDWLRLALYCKPVAGQTARKRWIYRHGYRVASLANDKQFFFVCRYCHQRRYIDANRGGIYETTRSTSTAARHLESQRAGHRHLAPGKTEREAVTGSSWLCQAFKSGLSVTQSVANSAGGFNVQAFRQAAVTWLVDNNHSLREFETPAFKKMLAAANPEAAAAL
jgi:hypothetical protein